MLLRVFAIPFAGQAGRVFVGAFAEAAAQAGGEADAGLAELVAQFVGRGEGIFPALLAIAFQEIDLGGLSRKRDACTPSRRTCTPFFQFLRNRARMCSKISVSSCVGFGSE